MACQYKCQSMQKQIPRLNQTEPNCKFPDMLKKLVTQVVAKKKKLQIKSFNTVVVFDPSSTCTDVATRERTWRQSI